MYYLGIDGSGAYARLIAVDESMKVIGKHTGMLFASGKIERDSVRDNLRKLLSEFNRMTNTVPNDCKGLCLGSGHMDSPDKRGMVEKIFEEFNLTFPLKLVNDARLMISAHTRGSAGVVVYSGAEAWGAAVNEEEKMYNCGGYGQLLDDGGSGYSIGIQAIKHALLAEDNRTEKTSLTEKITGHFKVKTINEVKDIVNSDKFTVNMAAELAILVKYESKNGDNTALEIESQAAISLAQIANALIKKAGLKSPLICMAGSVLLTNENIQKLFATLVMSKNKDATVAPLKEKLEMGALYLATKLRVEDDGK